MFEFQEPLDNYINREFERAFKRACKDLKEEVLRDDTNKKHKKKMIDKIKKR